MDVNCGGAQRREREARNYQQCYLHYAIETVTGDQIKWSLINCLPNFAERSTLGDRHPCRLAALPASGVSDLIVIHGSDLTVKGQCYFKPAPAFRHLEIWCQRVMSSWLHLLQKVLGEAIKFPIKPGFSVLFLQLWCFIWRSVSALLHWCGSQGPCCEPEESATLAGSIISLPGGTPWQSSCIGSFHW